MPITQKEYSIIVMKGILVIVLLNYLFYRSLWALLPLILVGILYIKIEKTHLLKSKRAKAKEQFKELLLLTATGQKAGYSVENAFLSAYGEMELLYGQDSSICQMLVLLKRGKENNVSFSQMWRKIGRWTDIPEIQEFSQIYEIAQSSSGNMTSIMEKTADILIQKLEVEKEINVMLSGKKMEQKIMNIMPIAIMLYMEITSPGYFDSMYHVSAGVLVMSMGLLVYLGAYALSLRMIAIEI